MSKRDIIISTVVIVVLVVLFLCSYPKYKSPTEDAALSPLGQRLTECGSFPNNSVQRVTETTRLFLTIPKDYYPDANLHIDQQGASAGYISNGGQPGYALGAEGKPNCWSYYFEFDGNGTVDITSKSGVSSTPPYHVQFIVSSSTEK